MIELGKTQALRVLRIKDVGVYLGEPGNEKVSVLLPKRQVKPLLDRLPARALHQLSVH